MVDTKACADTKLNRCLADRTGSYDDLVLQVEEATLTWVAGWIVVLVSSEEDTEHRLVLCNDFEEILCLQPRPKVSWSSHSYSSP